MSKGGSQRSDYTDIAAQGTLLGHDGQELKTGLWETGVYLGRDGFVYHIVAEQRRGSLQVKVAGKRSVGEYLRWVDGLFRGGELPGPASGVHYRAARKLREVI
jgi:hypothetical protein